jgi:hypothetical protein
MPFVDGQYYIPKIETARLRYLGHLLNRSHICVMRMMLEREAVTG